MGVRKVGKYTVLERQRAVETTIRLGRAAASLELGIPKGTLSCWAFLSRHGAGLVGGPLPSSESPGPVVVEDVGPGNEFSQQGAVFAEVGVFDPVEHTDDEIGGQDGHCDAG